MNTDVNTDTHMTVGGDWLGRRGASVGMGVDVIKINCIHI